MNPKEIFSILKKTASDWMEDQAPEDTKVLKIVRFAR